MSCSHHNKVTSWRQYRFAWQYQFRVWSVKTISTRNILALKYNSNMDSFQCWYRESWWHFKGTIKQIMDKITQKSPLHILREYWRTGQSNVFISLGNLISTMELISWSHLMFVTDVNVITSSDIVHITWHTASSQTHT